MIRKTISLDMESTDLSDHPFQHQFFVMAGEDLSMVRIEMPQASEICGEAGDLVFNLQQDARVTAALAREFQVAYGRILQEPEATDATPTEETGPTLAELPRLLLAEMHDRAEDTALDTLLMPERGLDLFARRPEPTVIVCRERVAHDIPFVRVEADRPNWQSPYGPAGRGKRRR